MKYGYARVSTDGSIDAQARQLMAAGAHQVFGKVARRERSCPAPRRATAIDQNHRTADLQTLKEAQRWPSARPAHRRRAKL
jgi:hypothetical protein